MARDKLRKKITTYQEGVTIRKREVEQAKVAIAKEEAELSKLMNEEKILRGLVEQLKGILCSFYHIKLLVINYIILSPDYFLLYFYFYPPTQIYITDGWCLKFLGF